MPAFPGSAWRGALGWSLKRAVCVIRHTPCQACLLYRNCMFPYVFETPPPPDSRKMRRYTAAPHPFVLRIEPGQSGPDYRLGLVLIGNAHRQLPYFIHALGEAGRQGIGARRQVFELVEVAQATGPWLGEWASIYTPDTPLAALPARTLPVPAIPGRAVVHLLSPLRLKHEDHLVTPVRFAFGFFFGALVRRLSLLTYFHTDRPWETDFAALSRRAGSVRPRRQQLEWYDWTRYSSRQDTTLEMGGILGEFELAGDDLAEFWPCLWLGQWTHAGKGATLGLGRYRITAAGLPETGEFPSPSPS